MNCAFTSLSAIKTLPCVFLSCLSNHSCAHMTWPQIVGSTSGSFCNQHWVKPLTRVRLSPSVHHSVLQPSCLLSGLESWQNQQWQLGGQKNSPLLSNLIFIPPYTEFAFSSISTSLGWIMKCHMNKRQCETSASPAFISLWQWTSSH